MHFFVSLRFSLSLNLHSISSERTRNEMAMEPRHVVCLSARCGGCFALLRARALTHTHVHHAEHSHSRCYVATQLVLLGGATFGMHVCARVCVYVRETARKWKKCRLAAPHNYVTFPIVVSIEYVKLCPKITDWQQFVIVV